MSTVRLEFPIDSGVKGVSPTLLVPVRDLREDELEAFRAADAGEDDILAAITGLTPKQVRKLTPKDRVNIAAARRDLAR